MAGKKFYSDEDIQAAHNALSGLPDLTTQRKTLRDFLDAIRDDIILLVRTKGYSIEDIRNTLKEAGYEVSEKSIRDTLRSAVPEKKNRRSSRKTATQPKSEPAQG
ncbi:molybdopterin-guanine dinucleotide biosynthesis protein MobC [Escherichia coli]|nr:transposase [Escherichia coli]EKK0607296.1 molybdopterin-guanine dinucleotide biosynthesis protein MobC [Escherichia coli]ELX1913494.1 molybdopterin-guanine dinucleotide biosynthesis protein MobC [Escherichia coli]